MKRIVSLYLLFIYAVGCGGEDADLACEANRRVACPCGPFVGYQECSPETQTWSICMCPDAFIEHPDAFLASDAGTPVHDALVAADSATPLDDSFAPTACLTPGLTCTDSAECCSEQTCSPRAFESPLLRCGVRPGQACASADECAGLQSCVHGACQCLSLGDDCAGDECCGSLECRDGSCSAPPEM